MGLAHAVSSGGGIQRLKGVAPAGTAPLHDQLFPADTLAFKGDYAEHQANVAGIGAPIVLVTSFDGIGHQEMRKKLPLRNLTAIVRFEGNTATLELIDPYQVETVTLAGRTHPLAADYGAAVMLGLSKARVDKLGLIRLLRPSRYNDTAHLNFLQPYDPKRIPVLMVHGLDSTPATFAPMYFKLLEDPEIREHYQFWVFSYPSGYPYPYSASLLRRELDHVQTRLSRPQGHGHHRPQHGQHDQPPDGHRRRTTSSGAKPSATRRRKRRFSGTQPRALLEDALVFRNRPEIDRAIFISGPHRGSILASNWIGRIASRLVQTPRLHGRCPERRWSPSPPPTSPALAMQQRSEQHRHPLAHQPLRRRNQQDPDRTRQSPTTRIMGDRGKGDTPDSSDGVVPYWSSHLDGAASEKIVPSGHGSHAESRRHRGSPPHPPPSPQESMRSSSPLTLDLSRCLFGVAGPRIAHQLQPLLNRHCLKKTPVPCSSCSMTDGQPRFPISRITLIRHSRKNKPTKLIP